MDKFDLVRRIERYIPLAILSFYRKFKRYVLWYWQMTIYKKEVIRLRNSKKTINVVFLALFRASWKYESLMKCMLNDCRFNPIILVCPVVNKGYQFMIETMNETYNAFVSERLPVLRSYDINNDSYVNIINLSPDILFYSGPYISQIDKRYNHITLRRFLKCYLNYAFVSVPYEWSIASSFHSSMWKYFSECEENKKLARSFGERYFSNIIVTGYPVYDEFVSTTAVGKDWKLIDRKIKRIIWAPHHTIEGHNDLLKFSTFLEMARPMLDYALAQESMQFVFKPHPLLLHALYNHPRWGKERTDAYYQQWANGVNTALVTGAYMDLFKSSDAMIHDCGSFIVEYLYTQKPVMYLGRNREEQSNIIGGKAYRCHYHGSTMEDIIKFLEEVVIKGCDNMKLMREHFYKEILLPPNNCSVAENIMNEIKQALRK